MSDIAVKLFIKKCFVVAIRDVAINTINGSMFTFFS
jgi:hypothetical protein